MSDQSTESKSYSYYIAVSADYKTDRRIYAIGANQEAALEAAHLGAEDDAQILIALPASDQLGLYLESKDSGDWDDVDWVILDEIAQLNPELRWCPDGEVPPGEE